MVRRILRATMILISVSVTLSGCNIHGKPTVSREAVTRATASRPMREAGRAVPGDSVSDGDIVAPGIVEPWGGQVDLSAREPGWIASIVVREGQVVLAGQLLATLDDEPQRRALEVARAELAEAEAALAKSERGATPEELQQARAQYEAAAARRDFARAAAERNSGLRAAGSLSENEWDRISSEAAAQAAVAERAEARLQELVRGTRVEDRDAARARAAAARARLQLAEANLERRRVTAPAESMVLLSRFHTGEYYAPNAEPLFVLGDLARLQVRLEVDEIDASDVRVGQRCTLRSDGNALLAQGAVVRLAPKMGRRALPIETPTARADVRVREVFVEVPATAALVPGQRVWGSTPRITERNPR